MACEHTDIEWGDDDERGVCQECKATCDWHWEEGVVDEGHDESGAYYAHIGRMRVIDEWHEKSEGEK